MRCLSYLIHLSPCSPPVPSSPQVCNAPSKRVEVVCTAIRLSVAVELICDECQCQCHQMSHRYAGRGNGTTVNTLSVCARLSTASLIKYLTRQRLSRPASPRLRCKGTSGHHWPIETRFGSFRSVNKLLEWQTRARETQQRQNGGGGGGHSML